VRRGTQSESWVVGFAGLGRGKFSIEAYKPGTIGTIASPARESAPPAPSLNARVLSSVISKIYQAELGCALQAASASVGLKAPAFGFPIEVSPKE
jgi:hypothetical protein